jgi:signal peptide peptidase SppA
MYTLPRIWAGSQEELDCLVAALDAVVSMTQAKGRSSPLDDDGLPELLAVEDGVATVSVRGSLISGTAGWLRLFGVTGYGDVQEALAEALRTKAVKAVLLNVASGGGAVEGADEASEFVRKVSSVKPVVTYASGPMASAAYWLGSAGTRRLGSRTSVVGSIGTLVVHVERSKMLEKEGINAKVIRSGRYKALANPYEPLSEKGEQQLQGIVDAMNAVFEERVATNLGVSAKVVHDRMGQGREFIGNQAVDVGLLDGISGFQEAHLTAKMLASARG